MSDVQPLLYIDDLDRGIAFYRDQLGFEVLVFGHHKETGLPLIAGAKMEDAFLLLSNEELFRDEASIGGGAVRLYFHVETPVDQLYRRFSEGPDVRIVQPPTDQHWGDRTVIIRDPWGVLLIFSNPIPE